MSKHKLLLADDSVTIQKVVNLTFADEGVEVISVGDGDSAMEKIAEISPDLIMADVNMPGLNGYQICEQIKQSENLANVPVILLVGSFEPFDEEEAKRVRADDYLTKPFQSIRQLVNKVTVLLNSAENKANEAVSNEYVSSFADTLEFEESSVENPATADSPYTDGFDDEMIQTNHISSFALDESAKFETKQDTFSEPDFNKTQTLTTDEVKEFGLAETSWEISNHDDDKLPSSVEETTETEGSISDESTAVGKPSQPFVGSDPISQVSPSFVAETSYQIVEDKASEYEADNGESDLSGSTSDTSEIKSPLQEEIPLPEIASILEADGDDLLELPPLEFDSEEFHRSEPAEEDKPESAEIHVGEQTDESQIAISPDLIEAIANRVVEKLSEKAVKEVAWEVVPQMTELIVKKMAEEKLKD